MLSRVNWLARALGFAWIGVLAFAIARPHSTSAVIAQAVGYAVLGAGLLAWTVLDAHPGRARLPIVLGVIAVGAGFGSAIGYGGTAMVAFAFVAALAAGGQLSSTGGLAVTAAGILAMEIGGLLFDGGYLAFLALPVITVAGLLIGRNYGNYRVQAEQAAQLLVQREQLQVEQRRADLLDERARIAREIHDVLAHSLGALGIQIQAARAVLSDHGDVEQAGELLATAQQMAAEGLVETRRAIHALRTDSRPLTDELAQVSDTYAQRYRVAVDLDTTGTPVPLAPDASLALLRTAQEALVNAAKHAAGQPVVVRLDYGDAAVRLIVRNELGADDRTSAVSTVDGGYGLTGLRERLQLLNGTLHAERRDGEWVVTAELPVESMTS